MNTRTKTFLWATFVAIIVLLTINFAFGATQNAEQDQHEGGCGGGTYVEPEVPEVERAITKSNGAPSCVKKQWLVVAKVDCVEYAIMVSKNVCTNITKLDHSLLRTTNICDYPNSLWTNVVY